MIVIKYLKLFYLFFNIFIFSCSINSYCTYNSNYIKPVSDIWKISKKGKVSYIVGSLHFGKPNDYLPKRISNVISQVDIIMTEVPLELVPNSMEDSKFKEYIDNAIDIKSGKFLYDKVGVEIYKKIINFIEKNDTLNDNFIKSVKYIEPWFLITQLSTYLITKNFTFNTSYEFLIIKETLNNKKVVNYYYLETMMDQYILFSSIKKEQLIEEISRYIEYDKYIEEEIKLSYKYFKNFEFNKFFSLQKNSIKQYKNYANFWQCFYINSLIYKRNKQWQEKILNQLTKKRVLIVVGMLHLFSQGGLLDILSKNGYKVEPVY